MCEHGRVLFKPHRYKKSEEVDGGHNLKWHIKVIQVVNVLYSDTVIKCA